MSRLLLAALIMAGATSCQAERAREFVNVAFTISVDVSHYATWDFDRASCKDFDVDWIDHPRLAALLFEDVEELLGEQGYQRVPNGDVDFRVSYEFWIEPGATRESLEPAARGSLVIRDGPTGAFIWRATRRAPVALDQGPESMDPGVRAFAEEMLDYVWKVKERVER